MTAQPYWRRLQFEPEVVAIVRGALKTRLWSGCPDERLEKIRALCRALSTHYAMPAPEVVVKQTPLGPHFIPPRRLIVLDKISVTSFLHEFAHALLDAREEPQNEEFPRAWSLGLFYTVAPRLFETARASGRLLFTDATGGA